MYTFIDSFIVYLKVEKNASPRTQESYQRDIWQFVDFMADEFKVSGEQVTPGQVDHLSVRRYLAELQKKGLHRSTIARKLAALRSFYRFLSREEVVSGNPMLRVSTPKLEKRLPEFLYEDEIRRKRLIPRRHQG